MPSPYWERQTSGFQQGIGNIATALARRPQIKARNAELKMEADRNAAQIDEAGARTGLYKNQAGESDARQKQLIQNGLLVETLRRTTPAALKAINEGRLDDPAIDEQAGAAAALTGQNKDDIIKAFRGQIATGLSLRNKTGMAAAVENPVSVENNRVNADERANRPVVAGSGSTVFNPDGMPIGEAATTLSPGQDRFAAKGGLGNLFSNIQLNDGAQPEATGQPLPPKSSEVQGVLARTIAQITAMPENKMDAKTKLATINAVKSQLGMIDNSAATPVPVAVNAPATPPAAQPKVITPAIQPPKTHVDYLKSHPEAAGDFDAKYGHGAAAKVLGQ